MKILIVDDSKTIRRVLTKSITSALKDTKVEFFEAGDGQAGLDILKDNLDVDFVFLDVNMPIMGGEQMLYIMRNSPDMIDIKVVMQTTEGVRTKVTKLTRMGVSGYLLKPYTHKTIATLMEKLLSTEEVTA